MGLEERVTDAKLNREQKEKLIQEYTNFIRARASNVMNRVITEQDDEYSIALIAFNEAIDSFNQEKGSFLAFAALVIKKRLLNYYRSESRHKRSVPFSSLGTWDKDGEELEFDIEDTKMQMNEAALEIKLAAEELELFQISFWELSKASPKTKKTKRMCNEVVRYIISEPMLIEWVRKKKTLPAKLIKERIKVTDKLLERHRKYIMAVSIILSGEYEILAEYFPEIRRGRQ